MHFRCNCVPNYCRLFFFIGWATDLKTVSQEVINSRAKRTGDGTHKYLKVDSNNNSFMEKDFSNHSNFWGWGEEVSVIDQNPDE